MKFLTMLFFSVCLSVQALTVTTTNVYSIRYFIGGEYDQIMCICDFGEVINTSRGWDIGAYQTQMNSMENRTIMTFDIRNIPLIVINTVYTNIISNVILNVPLQNQDNGLNSAIIDIFAYHNDPQVTTNNWAKGVYYKSFPDAPDLQTIDVTSLVKSSVMSGYTNLHMRMSTTVTNSNCVFVDPYWDTNFTSLIITYSSAILPPKKLTIQ